MTESRWHRICLPIQEKQETLLQSLGQAEALEKEMAVHCSILACEIQRSLAGYSPWSLKESDMTECACMRIFHRKKSMRLLVRKLCFNSSHLLLVT